MARNLASLSHTITSDSTACTNLTVTNGGSYYVNYDDVSVGGVVYVGGNGGYVYSGTPKPKSALDWLDERVNELRVKL